MVEQNMLEISNMLQTTALLIVSQLKLNFSQMTREEELDMYTKIRTKFAKRIILHLIKC